MRQPLPRPDAAGDDKFPARVGETGRTRAIVSGDNSSCENRRMAELPETRAIATRPEIWPAHFNLSIDGYFKMNLTDLLALTERLPHCESSQDVGTAFGDFVSSYGFVGAACGESREIPEGRSWEFFFNTWPAEWLLQYQKNDYVRHDLVPAVARLSARPFTWLEALAGRTPTAKQREHYDWAVGLGIVDVFAVPIHYPGGDFGLCVSIAGRPIQDTSERQALQMASMFAHQRCRELGGQREASSAPTLLTPREVECVRWMLEGKSDTDIGKILGISHTTVHFHIERAKKKLGVRTRTQAAAVVVSLGHL
jgi:DNA-binding CsgD family transcriptional regulator